MWRSVAIWLLIASAVRAADGPPLPVAPVVQTQRTYHGNIVWDSDTNALSFTLIIRSNSFLLRTIPTTTNFVTVSNLPGTLQGFSFTATAFNNGGTSGESGYAALRLVTILEGDSVTGPWRSFSSPVFEPTNSGRILFPSNFNADAWLKPD